MLNKIYKLVWNSSKARFEVASEAARSKGKSSKVMVGGVALAAMVFGSGSANALPPDVWQSVGTISSNTTYSPNLVTANVGGVLVTGDVNSGVGLYIAPDGLPVSDPTHVSAPSLTVNGDASAYGLRVTGNVAGVVGVDAHSTITVNAGNYLTNDTAVAYGIQAGSLSGQIQNAGNISVTADASDLAKAYGIRVDGGLSAGSVTNTGNISAQAGVSGYADVAKAEGIDVKSSATITNGPNASISAYATGISEAVAYGVKADGVVGGLTNAGTITSQAGAAGVDSASVAHGIYVKGDVAGGITNSGNVSAFATASDLVSAVAGSGEAAAIKVLGNVDSITNTNGLLATANANEEAKSYGIKVNGDVATITNNGTSGQLATISSNATSALGEAVAYGIKVGGSVTAGITNGKYGDIDVIAQSTGSDNVKATGIKVSGDVTGGLVNQGEITANATSAATAGDGGYVTSTGVKVGGNVDAISGNGSITSTATSSTTDLLGQAGNAKAYGIMVGGNVGTISLTDNTAKTNAVVVSAIGQEATAYGIKVEGSVGTITSSLTNGVNSTAFANEDAKSYAIKVDGDVGALTNTGALSAFSMSSGAASSYAVNVEGNLTTLTNSGAIGSVAISSGLLDPIAYGVKVGGSSDVIVNTSAGSIEAAAYADIKANAYGVSVNGDVTTSLSNAGKINALAVSTAEDAKAYGVKIGGTLGNSSSSVVDGVAQNTAFTNTGNISAYSQTSGDGALAIATGLKVSVLDGNIINSGVISGAASAGITQPDGTYSGSTTAQYYGYSVHIDDTVNSSVAYSLMNNLGGTLDGALKVEPSNIAVTNAGLVNTHEYLSNVAGNYTQTNTGMLNVDVRLNDGTGTVGGLNVGNPLRTNTVTAGGSTFDYGSLSVGGNAAFGTGNQFRVTAYGVCGVYNTDANCLATKSATEGALNAAASTPVVLNGVVTAGALKNLAGNTLSSSEVSSMVVTDNMLSVQFAAVLDGSNIDLVATQTNMTTVPNLANQGDLRSANGAAPLLDRLMTGPWLSQQQNIAYQSGSGTGSSTYGSQNGNSVVQQYLYYLGNSNNVTQASNKLQEALPLVTGGVSQATMGTLHSANGIIQSRQDSQSGMSSGDLFYGDKSVWFKPFGSWTNQDKKDGANGYNADTYGLAFGADGELSEANSIGLSFMYANSDVRGKIANPRADVDSYLFTVYGAHNFDESNVLSYQASAGWNDVSGSRPIVSTLYTASSNYTSRNYAASASLAHVMDLNETTKFVPSVKLAYARTHDDAYNETGAGGMDQHVDKATREEFVLSVDGKLNHPITESIMASANLGLGYDFIGDRASTTSYYIGDISGFSNVNFVTSGIKPSQWLGRFGLGLTGNITDTLDVNARYDLEVRDSYDNQTASVKVRYKF